jgi:hypothetical protein
MSGWIKIGVEFIKALPGQWKGSSPPNASGEAMDTVAEGASSASQAHLRSALNRAEGHINERLAARGETWQLDAASRKQLGLPPPKTRLD